MPQGPAAAPAPVSGGGNRKKQKRREKEAAKRAAEAQRQLQASAKNGAVSTPHGQRSAALAPGSAQAPQPPRAGQPAPGYAESNLDDRYDEDSPYSDDDDEHYDPTYPSAPNGDPATSYVAAPPPRENKKSKKKKRGSSAAQQQQPSFNPPLLSRNSSNTAPKSKSTDDRIWSTSTDEERERIREFWLSLGEEDRKSLVKIEKEAVLRKMKEQQKHSCSCTVCGRKRTAIEEELEVLYDAYYEELEQYANHQQDGPPLLHPVRYPHPRHHAHSHMHHRSAPTRPPVEHYDDEGDYSQSDDEDADQDFSNSEISSEGDYDSEERTSLPPDQADFLQFGSSLQVKGGILTVADDLLKNDGKKFIEMMEQLAERRMQREEEAQYQNHSSMYGRSHPSHGHVQPDEDDYDEEDDDEDGYDDDDYEEDDEDEDDTMTEEQRMEEGRRMFQIFAARMFEQRVLQAYREKVAAERQQKLLEELAEEDYEKAQLEEKKRREAEKRKEKREKQRQAKAEERKRKEDEQRAKEEAAKAAEAKRLEEQRKKREEQKKKKEAEKKAHEEERQRKEAERLRRQQEERERQQEHERKQRAEKKAKEEARRKEREEREAREKEAKEKKAQEEKERREREAKAKAEKERIRKEEQAAAAARKAAQPGVAMPPQLLKQPSSGVSSPHVTPALPKAPTPNRPRQSSQHGSHGSSPKTPHLAPGTSKSVSPASQLQNPMAPKSILTKPSQSQHPAPLHVGQGTSSMPPIGPPPGMHGPSPMGIGMPPGLNGFPHSPNPMMALPGMLPRHSLGHNMPMFAPQPNQPFRGFAPPGVHAPSPLPIGRSGFSVDGPPGFGNMPPAFASPNQPPGFGMGMPAHSRQTSGSLDKAESPIIAPGAQPIQRPTPIQRPSSTKPHEDSKAPNLSDVDEVADHLGSKALLDDAEEEPPIEPRRPSQQAHSLRGVPMGFNGFPVQPRTESFSMPFGSGASSADVWGTPPPIPFSMGAAHGWGNSPTTGMGPFTNPFPVAGATRPHEPRPNEPRVVWLRRLLCSVCKSNTLSTGPDGYIDATAVQRELNRVTGLSKAADKLITLAEMKDACDIFGDPSNGGGSLEYKESDSAPGDLSSIKFVEGRGHSNPLGEIGSPVPGHSLPHILPLSGGRPFPGLGPQGF